MRYPVLTSLALFACATLAACGDTGNGPNVIQPPAGPNPPSALTATAMSSSTISLSWTDASGDENEFWIERCAGAVCANFAYLGKAPANANSYWDITVAGGSSYSYRVRAGNTVGTSAFSNTATAVTPQAGAIPAPPTNFAATAISSSRIDLSWTDASTTEDGFRIERCQGSGCTDFNLYAVTLTPNGTAMSSSALLAATTYRYRIQSYNGSGRSAFAGPVTATTLAAAPAAPSGLTATATSSSRIALTWTDNSSDEDGFSVERCLESRCSIFTPVGTTSMASFEDSNVVARTAYRYRVIAYNGGGPSAPSNTVRVTTPAAATAPVAPSGLTATAVSSSYVQLSWTDASANEDRFVIDRCAGPGCSGFAQIQEAPSNATVLGDINVASGTSYSYRVRAENADGSSPSSNIATAVTPQSGPIPAPPTNLSATALSSSEIKLRWTDASTTEDGFFYERCEGSGCSSFVRWAMTVTPNDTVTIDGHRQPGTTYRYRIQSYNGAGSSAYAGPVEATTAPATNPAIGVSVTSRTFSAIAGGANPTNQQAQVINTGTGTLTGLQAVESPAVSWLSASFSGTTAPATLTFQVTTGSLAAGTYTTTVNVTSPVASNSPQAVAVTFTVAPQPTRPTTLRIINDLPGNVAGTNDWGKMNRVVRLRVGPTQSSVINLNSGAVELLYPLDYTSDAGNTLSIAPGTQQTFDVSAMTGEYFLYIQNGWWEYFTESGQWEKHMTGVVGCDGATTVYKGTIIPIIRPFGNPEEIRLSDWLPIGNYYQSPFCP